MIVRQVKGLYLPSFKARNVKIKINVKINVKTLIGSIIIIHGLSQALLLQSDKSFLSNLGTSAEIYERIAQDSKQISKREEREAFLTDNEILLRVIYLQV